MAKQSTLGRFLLEKALPKDMSVSDYFPLHKNNMRKLISDLIENHPDDYVDILEGLNNIGRKVVTNYGRESSLSLKDLKVPPESKKRMKVINNAIQRIIGDPGLDSDTKKHRIANYVSRIHEDTVNRLYDEALSRNNAFASQINSGVRGSKDQLAQMLLGDLTLTDHNGELLPITGLHGYAAGVTPPEYWASTLSGRKNMADTQFATAKSGFLGKQLASAAQTVKVTEHDCGTTEGVIYKGDDNDMIGQVLQKSIVGIPSGTLLSKKDVYTIPDDEEVIIRSTHTCDSERGVCSKCAGANPRGDLYSKGAHIGMASARFIAEPLVQTAVGSKHGVKSALDKGTSLEGFDVIDQFIAVPKLFKGGAIISTVEGGVDNVVKAPQGGNYVTVNSEQYYVPTDRSVLVKKGQEIEKGDVLSTGLPSPAEIAKYKGIGKGREYFTNTLYDILQNSGVSVHKSHIENLSRGLIDNVKITDNTVKGYEIGDIVPYSSLRKTYKPRKDAEEVRISHARGRYLEKPILSYSIGTKISKDVINRLNKHGYKNILVSKKPPSFVPYVVRPMDQVTKSKDWKTRLGGWNVKRSLLDAVNKGLGSSLDDPSYIAKAMQPTLL